MAVSTSRFLNIKMIPRLPLDLGSGDEKVLKLDCRKFLTPGYTTSGHVELYTVSAHVFLHLAGSSPQNFG